MSVFLLGFHVLLTAVCQCLTVSETYEALSKYL